MWCFLMCISKNRQERHPKVPCFRLFCKKSTLEKKKEGKYLAE